MTIWLLVALFLAGIVLSTVLTGLVLLMLPADYFVKRAEGPVKRPPWAIALLVLKNLAGLALVVLGVVLSIPGVPGQGLLTMFAGLLLLDLPGKRRVELAILRKPFMQRTVDRLRYRFGRPPLELP